MSSQPNSNAINPHLLREAHWLLHRNKKPYYTTGRPRSGTLDSSVDLRNLAAYDDAVAALNESHGKFTGLGFAINRGFQFIDLDDCRDASTGEIAQWAKWLVDRAVALDAFVEISISGTGIHIVGHGREVPTFKGLHVEVYGSRRFMALGVGVLSTGADTLPDLEPLLEAMGEAKLTSRLARPRPELTLVKPVLALLWPEEKAKAAELLKVLDPDFSYPQWINVGMALHSASGGNAEGLEMWTEWSRGSAKFKEGECAKYWRGFKAGGGLTMGTLVHMAQQQSPRDAQRPQDDPAKAFKPLPPPSAPQRRRRATHREMMSVVHPPTPWAVADLIAPGLTLLAAPPKAGKSYFVLQMGLCVAAGKPFLGRQTKKQKVVYFNLEEWENMLQPRAVDICRENGIDDPDLGMEYIFDMDLADDETFLHEAQREIDAGAGVLIIDLLARVRDELREDAKKNAYARDYNALKAIADFILKRNSWVCIIIVHHTNKGQHEDWQSKISGSQGLAGASHCNIVLHGLDKRGVDDATRKKLLDYRHLGVAGKQVKGQELMIKMMANGGGWEVTDDTEEDVKTFGTRARILQILREANGAWMTAKEVYENCDGTQLAAIKKMLGRMAQNGEIVSSGSGGKGFRIVPADDA